MKFWVYMSFLGLHVLSALFVPTTYSFEIMGLHESYVDLHVCSATLCPHFLNLGDLGLH